MAPGSSVELFFGGWAPIVRIAVVGVASYLTVIAFLRIAGARTLTSITPFDFVIVIAIGSTFGRLLTAREVPLAEAVTAFAILIGLQVLFSWLRTQHPRVLRTFSPHPVLVFFRGHFLPETMAQQRIAEGDLRTAVRESGLGSMAEVEAIVLVTNGRFAVIPARSAGDGSALVDVVRQDPLPVADPRAAPAENAFPPE